MKKLSTAIIFTLMAFFATTTSAFANNIQAHNCDSSAKVMRDYKSNPSAWKNRNLYIESRKANVYFQANCVSGSKGAVANANLTPSTKAAVRMANGKDFYNAGYRKGIIAGQLSAKNASSVTNPMEPKTKVVYVDRPVYVTAPQPKKVVVPAVKRKVARIQHGNHSHHTEAQRLDCALTDTLNRQAGPVTTVINRVTSPTNFSKAPSFGKAPSFSKVRSFSKRAPMIKHGNHNHHSHSDKEDCALVDSLNRQAGPVVKVVRTY